jgi:hypothetical protein
LEQRALFEGKSYVYLRSAFQSTLYSYFQALSRIVKWIGGIYHVRTHVGDSGNSLPFEVVEYEKQRRALDIIKTKLLIPDAFKFDPKFIQKLQIDRHFDFENMGDLQQAVSQGRFRLDFSLTYFMRNFYQNILRMLYDPMRLHRIQDNEMRTTGKKLMLGDYMRELYAAIWQELTEEQPISVFRRILQREYLNRVSDIVLKPSPAAPDDMIAVCRYQLRRLHESIGMYMTRNPDMDMLTQAHLEHCSDIIGETLKAVVTKTK